jgi:hypothetical protein
VVQFSQHFQKLASQHQNLNDGDEVSFSNAGSPRGFYCTGVTLHISARVMQLFSEFVIVD